MTTESCFQSALLSVKKHEDVYLGTEHQMQACVPVNTIKKYDSTS